MKQTRRGLLAAAVSACVAGCNGINPPSVQESGEIDSDDDGVPNSEDYAPEDRNVSSIEDVWSEYNPTVQTPTTFPTTESFLTSEPANRVIESGEYNRPRNTSRPRWISAIDSNPSGEVTVFIPQRAVGEISSQKCLLVCGQYPTGELYTMQDSEIKERKAKFGINTDKIDQNNLFYFTAYLLSSDGSAKDVRGNILKYLCESTPYVAGNSGWDTTAPELDDYNSNNLSRYAVNGGYICTTTIEEPTYSTQITYFISRSNYMLQAATEGGRSRKEYPGFLQSTGEYTELQQTLLPEIQHSVSDDTVSTEKAIVDFVQSLYYVRDSISSGFDDYTQTPTETLAIQQGDCEDTSLLLAALLSASGRDTVLIEFPQHIGVGIQGNYSGASASYNEIEYYYIETTSQNWEIGDFPNTLSREDVTLYPVPTVDTEED